MGSVVIMEGLRSMKEDYKDIIRRICTYYSELGEGTAGYSLSEKQFAALFDFIETLNDKQKEALEKIENQLYGINARNISMQWIGLNKTPTRKEISDLNAMLGFIIQELRTLRETGELDVDAVHKKVFKEV